ncbi:hypothetical protein DTO96_101000 [Ephemeroptericola cinctiostellae]|uniref:Uncharacterized protein n=1 Tax=Ephemeroptericola cinctiostellae TaxID=2268024 RepID=A0A345DA86_9BURK|nr:hypothetical protein DTO96_101000 [Ephemeroptericola cinctiostellae]
MIGMKQMAFQSTHSFIMITGLSSPFVWNYCINELIKKNDCAILSTGWINIKCGSPIMPKIQVMAYNCDIMDGAHDSVGAAYFV